MKNQYQELIDTTPIDSRLEGMWTIRIFTHKNLVGWKADCLNREVSLGDFVKLSGPKSYDHRPFMVAVLRVKEQAINSVKAFELESSKKQKKLNKNAQKAV